MNLWSKSQFQTPNTTFDFEPPPHSNWTSIWHLLLARSVFQLFLKILLLLPLHMLHIVVHLNDIWTPSLCIYRCVCLCLCWCLCLCLCLLIIILNSTLRAIVDIAMKGHSGRGHSNTLRGPPLDFLLKSIFDSLNFLTIQTFSMKSAFGLQFWSFWSNLSMPSWFLFFQCCWLPSYPHPQSWWSAPKQQMFRRNLQYNMSSCNYLYFHSAP